MPIDQLSLDILWNRLIATVNEQAATLMRSSFTSIVREAGDLSAGVFDRRGRMVAQAVTGTPGHINSMATGVVHFLERFPIDTIEPGDVLVTNDPWKTASQLNDITVVTPVFKAGKLVALFANCCHALDIGGRGLSADSRSVFEEGLFIPVMKLYDRGKPVEAFFDLLQANVRTPEEVLGDIHSQVVGNGAGAKQLLSFMDEFDLDDIEKLSDEIISRSETAMRQRIRDLPDGRYTYQLSIDGFEDPLELKAQIIVADDELTVDFAGSPGSVPLGVNVCLNYTAAYTTYGIKCALSPDVPNNEGSFRPVHIKAPEGSLLNAKYPAAIGGTASGWPFPALRRYGRACQGPAGSRHGSGLRRSLGYTYFRDNRKDRQTFFVHLVRIPVEQEHCAIRTVYRQRHTRVALLVSQLK